MKIRLFFALCTLVFFHQIKSQNAQVTFNKYIQKSYDFIDDRKLDSAKIYLKKLDSLQHILNDSTFFYRTEVVSGALLIRNNQPDESILKLLKCEKYFKHKKDSANIGLTLLKLGIANYYVNRRLKTKSYMKQALLYKNHLSKKIITRLYRNIGSVNFEEGYRGKNDSLFKQSKESYEKAISISKQENWHTDLALTYSLLAEWYNQNKEYNNALTYINKAITVGKKSKNESQLGFALIKKGSILCNINRCKEGLSPVKKAKKIFKLLKDNPSLLYAYNQEKILLKKIKKYKEASILGDSIFNLSVQNYNLRFADKISEMEAKYQTAEKEKEIAKQKEEILAQELQIKNRNLFTLLVGGAFIMLGIISFGYYNRSKFIKKQLEKELELKEALATIKTQNRLQEQRLQISRDLHDNIGSQLTFITSSLDNLQFISKDLSEKMKEKISGISSFTVDTIHQLRDTIWAMNKSEINLEEFSTRTLSFIEKAKIATNNTIKFDIRTEIKQPVLLTSIQGINLFRSLQEAINNAIKYANAKVITINSKIEKNTLYIFITDNGKGFEINKVTLGNGLSNIEHRMSEINGKAKIKSAKEKGTQIELILPL